MKRITHIISGLGMGGAEKMLYKLVSKTDLTKFEVEVISLSSKGVYGDKIEELGIKVIAFNLKSNPKSIFSMLKYLYSKKEYDIIQTWMYHADLLGYILMKTKKVEKLIWGIRRSNVSKSHMKLSTLFIARLNAFLSKNVDKIISCSEKAKTTHVNIGYEESKIVVIPNGFEIPEIYLSTSNTEKKKEVIIHVARWTPIKDHRNLLEAAAKIKCDFVLYLIGPNVDNDNKELNQLIQDLDLEEKVILFGAQNDLSSFFKEAKLLVSSSIDEGFPNVIGEAMSYGVPCVVTDAGDSKYIVGETGIVVEPRNPLQLARGMESIMNLEHYEFCKLSAEARKRVISNFSITKVVKLYEDNYQ